MPELPEIETVKRTLTPLVIGSRVLAVEAARPEVIKGPAADKFRAHLPGRAIAGLGRRGKYLLLHLDDEARVAVHLRMTGRFLAAAPDSPRLPHTHVIISLDNGLELRFSDTRRFGCLWLLLPGAEDDFTGMEKLGREPLEPDFTAEYVEEKLGRRSIAVKSGILDQSVIAGLGNIYADEVLFAAGIQPERPCSSLSRAEWQAVAGAIPPILLSAIEHRGTTFSDFLDGQGREGENMAFLQAYGRAGRPCPRCGAEMRKTRVGGRGTSYCPACQR